MTDAKRRAQRPTEPDPKPPAAYPEPLPPPPEVEGTYRCVYGIWHDGRYHAPGELIQVLPSHPRVLAGQAVPLRDTPSAEQAEAIAAAEAAAKS